MVAGAASRSSSLRRIVAVVVVSGAGCAARPAPAPATAVAAPAAVPVPARVTAAEPEPAWIRDLKIELTALRGLTFKREVLFSHENRTAFRERVRSELARELPPPKSAAMSRAYAALGFVPGEVDLAQAVEKALVTEVAAYYDPKTGAFKFVERKQASAGKTGIDTVAFHELAHALADQHFDLEAFQSEERRPDLDDDQQLARRSVVEGEATFLMMAHDLGSGPPEQRRLGPLAVAGLRMNITMLAAADTLELLASLREGSSLADLDADARNELAAIEHLPAFVTRPLIEPYFKGAWFISEVWAAGGWAAVNDVYRHPPDSMEQVLHPTEKFLRGRDPAIVIRLGQDAKHVPLPGATLLIEEVVGELGWRAFFKTWDIARGDAAAAGWGGDRMWAWAVGARTVACIATSWDSDADAREFLDVYEEALSARFPFATALAGTTAGFRLARANGEAIAAERRGRDVDVVVGATETELATLQQLLRTAQRQPRRIEP